VIPIPGTAKAAFQTLAEPFLGSQLILGIKLDPSSFGRIFVNVRMYGLILFFGSIAQERDDEADSVDFLYQGIAEVVQLNLDIMYEALCVLGIPGEGVNSKFLWLLRLITLLLGLMTLLNKLIQSCISSTILVLLFLTPLVLATAKEVSQIGGGHRIHYYQTKKNWNHPDHLLKQRFRLWEVAHLKCLRCFHLGLPQACHSRQTVLPPARPHPSDQTVGARVNVVGAVDGRIVEVGVSGNHAENPRSRLPYVGSTQNRYNSFSW